MTLLERSSPSRPTFSEKVGRFSIDYLKSCQYILTPEPSGHLREFTKKLYSELIATSLVLEDFLDYNGAKKNKAWFLYRELSAAVRHLSLGGYAQKHILNRLIFYDLGDTRGFEAEGIQTLSFIQESLAKLAPVIIDEAKRLDISIPQNNYTPSDFPEISATDRLQADINDEEKSQQRKHIVKIASEFLSIAKHFDQHTFYTPYSLQEIRQIVPEQINEVEIRRYEMLVHNLQSAFDTYVVHSALNQEHNNLHQLRSHFSVVFHLLQMMGRLLHFYERHLHEAGYKDLYKKVRNQLSFLVDPERLLDRTINYGLYYACHFLGKGKEIAQRILDDNIERAYIEVGIPVPRGFHSRPSLLVAKIVQHYGGQVELCAGDGRFDASSVLDIQWAGGKISNEKITLVKFEGDVRSLKDLEILAKVNYGEDAMGNGIPLPVELHYLRD